MKSDKPREWIGTLKFAGWIAAFVLAILIVAFLCGK